MGVEFTLLGPVGLRVDGTAKSPRSQLQIALLAGLLLAGGSAVPVDQLAGWLWDAEPPADERAALQVAVSRLRSWLGGAGVAAEITHSPAGYALTTAATTDLAEFRRLTAAAGIQGQLELYRQAIALWRGTVVADVQGRLRDSALVLGVQEEYRRMLCGYGDASVSAGRPELCLAALESLAEAEPYAEDVHTTLARAYAAADRRADAITVIDRIRTRLADDLGVDPGPGVAQAQMDILRGRTEIPAKPSEIKWWGLHPRAPHLVGRDRQLRLALGRLELARLVTVTGAAGCGKTALAWSIADTCARQVSGIAVLELAALADRVAVLSGLGAMFGVATDVPDGVVAEVGRRIGDWAVLLVVDNCEHLLPEIGEIVAGLLARCPNLRVLATSQRPLGIDDEQLLPLEPLPVPGGFDETNPAVELFLHRTRAAVGDLALDQDGRTAVTEICRRLDGVPLALELAAGRVRSLGLRELADRLSHDFRLLSRHQRDGGRHDTLAAAVSWSYRLLPANARRLLARLAVFGHGTFGLADAEHVAGFPPLSPDDVALLVGDLVDRSLLQPVGTRRGGYQLLAPVHELAAGALAESGELAEAGGRHLAGWLTVAERIDRQVSFWDRRTAVDDLDAEIPRLHHALATAAECGQEVLMARVVALMHDYWWTRSTYLPMARKFLDDALAVADRCPPETQALLRFHDAQWLRLTGRCEEALATITAVTEELRTLRPREYLSALIFGVTVRRYLLSPDTVEVADAAVTEVTKLDDEEGSEASTILTSAGWVHAAWGDWRTARDLCRRYEMRNTKLRRPASLPQLVLRAEIALGRGDAAATARWCEQVAERLRTVGDPAEQEPARAVLAKSLLVSGKPGEAKEFLTRALAEYTEAYPTISGRTAQLGILLAESLRRLDDLDACRGALVAALASLIDTTDFHVALTGVLVAARLAAAQGDTETADELGTGWAAVRAGLGLPVPTGFEPPEVSAAPVQWSVEHLRALVERAYLSTALLP